MSRFFSSIRQLVPYFALTYLALAFNAALNLRHVQLTGAATPLFCIAATLVYTLAYMLPGVVLLALLDAAMGMAEMLHAGNRPRLRLGVVGAASVLFFGITHVVLFADRFIYANYSFHINGFVSNLVFTTGGIESLGADKSTILSFALVIVFLAALQAGLLAASLKIRPVRVALDKLRSWKAVATVAGVVLFLGLFQGVAFGLSNLKGYGPVMIAARAIPLFQPMTFRRFAERMGIKPAEKNSLKMDSGPITLKYPLQPIERRPDAPHYNVVWLVAESWRASMLDPEIMPRTWAFSQRAARFQQHYSAGNGTRMALFGLFYGLYGNYWFPFLEERRGPVMMDMLIKDGYQFDLRTSAKFTYPEFDKTLFASIPSAQLHEAAKGQGWECDRRNVTEMLKFLDSRDKTKPFMCFEFFESPHARYYFPPECAIRKLYLDEFNYATVNLERDAPLIYARYVNSCNHLDTQIARVLDKLEQEKLLDSTIVIITGDHGEEFMEEGHWGHNSYYNEPQTLVPMVIWAPGRAPEVVDRMTSHLDVPATVMTLLGATNPPEDYSLGFDMFGPQKREYCVLAGWGNVAYVDSEFKVTLPTSAAGMQYGQQVTTKEDKPVSDTKAFFQSRKNRLVQVMKEMSRFSRGKTEEAPTADTKAFNADRAAHKHVDPLHRKIIE